MRTIMVLALIMAAASPAGATTPAYKLVSDELSEARRVIAVRIDRRLADTELARVAETAKARPSAAASRTLVKFFTGRPHADEMPWATATFAPDLKLVINGLSVEEAEQMTLEARDDKRTLVGSWLMGPPVAPGRLTIFRDQGKVYAEWRLRGGQRTVEELAEARWNGGSRFDIRGDDRQFYAVGRDGALDLRDKTKVITSVDPIDMAAPATSMLPAGTGVTVKEAGGAVVVRALPVEGQDRGAAAIASQRPLMRPVPSSSGDGATSSLGSGTSAVVSVTTTGTAGATGKAGGTVAANAEVHYAPAGRTPPAQSVAEPARRVPQKHARRKAAPSRPDTPHKAKDDSVAALMASKFGQR